MLTNSKELRIVILPTGVEVYLANGSKRCSLAALQALLKSLFIILEIKCILIMIEVWAFITIG